MRPKFFPNDVRLCDYLGRSEDCKLCPFGFMDANAICPVFHDVDQAIVEMKVLSQECLSAANKLERA